MGPFPRTDLQDPSCSHEMSSLDSLSWNNFQKWPIGRNRMEAKKSRLRKKCHWSCFSFFYRLSFKVFSCILINTKSGLEKLSSDLPAEPKYIGMYYRNTSVFLKLDRKLSREMHIGTFCRCCWKLERSPLSFTTYSVLSWTCFGILFV